MSAPVTFSSASPCARLQTRSPRLSVGGFAISLRFGLGRASPRLTKANKAQKEEAYEYARRLVHVLQDVRACRGPLFVFQPQIRRPGVDTPRTHRLAKVPVEFAFLCPPPWARSCGIRTWSAPPPASRTSSTSTCTWCTR